jgi:hypothetical protein
VSLFLRRAGEPEAVRAFEANRDLLKEWRRCFAEDPEGCGGPVREPLYRKGSRLDGVLSSTFGELFGKAGPGCAGILFAAVRRIPLCWVAITLRAGPGEAALLEAGVPGGRVFPPLLSPGGRDGGQGAAAPFADPSPARIASLARISLPVAFGGIVLATEGALASWLPEAARGRPSPASWGSWWTGPFRVAAPELFEPASGLSARSASLARSLSRPAPGRAATVIM